MAIFPLPDIRKIYIPRRGLTNIQINDRWKSGKGDLFFIVRHTFLCGVNIPLKEHLIAGPIFQSFKRDKIEPFEPSIFLNDGDSLKTYGVDVTVVGLPGHTKGSIGLNVKGEGFIVGDALMNIFYPTRSMMYGNFDETKKSAIKISNTQVERIYFGHGKPVSNRMW